MKLDRTDLRILAVLQREGRITKLELARRVHLSPTPCWERLHRLEQAGIIRGYHADVSLAALGPHATAITEVTLASHTRDDFERFEAAVRAVPEIVGCWATGGGIDYVLRVVTRDVERYQRLMERLLADDIGIDRYFSYFVTKPVKESGVPVEVIVEPDPGR